MDSYKTIQKQSENEFVEKKSRFIGHICPISIEADAIAFVNRIKTKHPQATHNCWAYILRENNIQRYSDDGEPQGTAGIPILEVLKKEEIVDVAVVVTRYFGGVMLGAGGLIRAYSHGAKIALDAGERVVMAECAILQILLPYNLYDLFLSMSESYPMKIVKTDYAEEISLIVRVRLDYMENMGNMLTELSSGSIKPEIINRTFAQI